MNRRKYFALVVIATVLCCPTTSLYAFDNANDHLDHGIDLYDDHRFENAADTLHTLVKHRLFRRLDDIEKSLALSHLIYSLSDQGKTREALGYSEKLLGSTRHAFKKNSLEYVHALRIKAVLEFRLKKGRAALRTIREMKSILERLGSGYVDEWDDIKRLTSSIQRNNWDDDDLRKDLSDFYTTCESIKSGDNLPGVTRLMHEHLLVGKDYRPSGKLKRTFKTTYIKKARENSRDRKNRLIFIPDKKHKQDWCVVYPDGVLVDRAVIVPPED